MNVSVTKIVELLCGSRDERGDMISVFVGISMLEGMKKDGVDEMVNITDVRSGTEGENGSDITGKDVAGSRVVEV